MLMEAFLLTPYLAMASSPVLAATVAVVCRSQSAPRGAGLHGLSFPRGVMANLAHTIRQF